MVSDSSLSGSFNPVNSMSCSSSIASLAAAVQSHFAQPATDPDQLPLGDAVMTLTGSLDQPNEPASMDPLQLPDGDAKLSPGRSLLSVLGDAARSDMVSLLPSQLPAQAGDAESSGLLLQPPERSANRPGNSGCLPVEAMFFSEPAPHEDAIGPRFEPVWAKEIGGRVRKGFNSETLTRAYPRPGHHFCQVPVWSDSADVFTRLFGTTPGRYRDTRSLDDQLCKLQADQLDTRPGIRVNDVTGRCLQTSNPTRSCGPQRSSLLPGGQYQPDHSSETQKSFRTFSASICLPKRVAVSF